MRILKLINSKCSFMTSFKSYLFLFLWLSGVQIVLGQSISETFLVKPYLQYGSQTGIFVLWETIELGLMKAIANIVISCKKSGTRSTGIPSRISPNA